jgi:hypothetical protein
MVKLSKYGAIEATYLTIYRLSGPLNDLRIVSYLGSKSSDFVMM